MFFFFLWQWSPILEDLANCTVKFSTHIKHLFNYLGERVTLLLNSYVLVKVEEHIDAQLEIVSSGHQGGLSPLLLKELAPRQWW